MKKNVILFVGFCVLLIITFLFYFKEDKTNFKTPHLISFEEQQVLKNYDWSLIGLDGDSFNLIVKAKKVIVIKYFSLTNEESKKELDVFNKIYNDFKTKVDFVIIVEDKQPEVRSYLKENDFLFPVCYSLSKPPFEFESKNKSFRSLVISPSGRIVIDNYEPINWDSDEVRDVLNGLTK